MLRVRGVIRVLGVLAAVAGLQTACSKPPVPYPDQIAAWHAEKDRFMRESAESPVPAERRASYCSKPLRLSCGEKPWLA